MSCLLRGQVFARGDGPLLQALSPRRHRNVAAEQAPERRAGACMLAGFELGFSVRARCGATPVAMA